jgi:hypothetical protein
MPKSPSRKKTLKKVQKSKANRKSVSKTKSKSLNKSVRKSANKRVNRKKVIRMRFDDKVANEIVNNAEKYKLHPEIIDYIKAELRKNTPQSIGNIPIRLFPDYVQDKLLDASNEKEPQDIAFEILNPTVAERAMAKSNALIRAIAKHNAKHNAKLYKPLRSRTRR